MSLVLNVEILGEYKNLTKATKGAEKTLANLGSKFATVGKNIGKVVGGIGLGLGAAVASQIKHFNPIHRLKFWSFSRIFVWMPSVNSCTKSIAVGADCLVAA